ncbi:hypothetical protein [Bradyrhizobium sp. STM 3562]
MEVFESLKVRSPDEIAFARGAVTEHIEGLMASGVQTRSAPFQLGLKA